MVQSLEIVDYVYLNNNLTAENVIEKFKGLKFTHLPILMGVLNLTPDSFSDGGKYIKKNLGEKQAKNLIKHGCGILDIGGEATNPGSGC